MHSLSRRYSLRYRAGVALFALGFSACGELPSAAPSAPVAPFAALAQTSTPPSDGVDAGAPTPSAQRCVPPRSCKALRTNAFQFEACCSDTVACGLDMSPFGGVGEEELPQETLDQVFPPGFSRENGCVRPGSMYIPVAGAPEERVSTAGNPDILITPECKTYNVFSFPMPGCCLPSGKCGLSTHRVLSNLTPFVSPRSPIHEPQCVSGPEFNRQLKGSLIERIGDAPDITATCGYAALDARLPPDPPEPEDDAP